MDHDEDAVPGELLKGIEKYIKSELLDRLERDNEGNIVDKKAFENIIMTFARLNHDEFIGKDDEIDNEMFKITKNLEKELELFVEHCAATIFNIKPAADDS